MGSMIQIGILHYMGFYKALIEAKIMFGQRSWGVIVDSLVEEPKLTPPPSFPL